MSESSGQIEQASKVQDGSITGPDLRAKNAVDELASRTHNEEERRRAAEDPHATMAGTVETLRRRDGAEDLKESNDNAVDGHEEGEAVAGVHSSRAADIEQEASEHLARRAAEMSGTGQGEALNIADRGDHPNYDEGTKDATPPTVPPKLKESANPQSADMDYDEKHPHDDDVRADLPEAPHGTKEMTGAEIQNIMDQFQGGGPGMEEIMSPRFERQQTVLVLPTRTSSLEARENFDISLETTGQHTDPPTGHDVSDLAVPSSAGGSATVKASDDATSIRSVKAGSIFQPPPPAPDPESALPFDFHRFLEQLRHRTADPVARFLRSFLQEFGKKQWMVHEQVKIISDFLEFIAKKMSQCEVWRTVSDAEFENAREGMEKLVMNRLYSQTFSPAIPAPSGSPRKGGKGTRSQADAANPNGPGRRGQHQEDVERDEVIAQKIRIYGWISEEHLDIKPISEKGRKFLSLAQQELLKINTYRAPRDKVICVLNCCKVIFGFLKNAKADQSADAFVPLLIFTVLRARPEHLVSNVQYIWRFRSQKKLGGEAAYYMSSLMGVISFIENLDRTNLTVSDEEFERNVEQAVSAIAEKNKQQEYEEKAHVALTAAPMQHLTEKGALARAEVTQRNSMDAERSSPRRTASPRVSEKVQDSTKQDDDDDFDAVTGLLRSIQKPLSSLGRMFSDDGSSQQQSNTGLRPASTPLPGSTPRGPSPAPRLNADGKVNQRPSAEKDRSQRGANAEDAAARQVRAEAAEAHKVRVREHKVVVETLQSMFPNLDKDVIEDVVRSQEGNVGRAVDACLALSG